MSAQLYITDRDAMRITSVGDRLCIDTPEGALTARLSKPETITQLRLALLDIESTNHERREYAAREPA